MIVVNILIITINVIAEIGSKDSARKNKKIDSLTQFLKEQ